jgi:hypothetical protein
MPILAAGIFALGRSAVALLVAAIMIFAFGVLWLKSK